MLNEKTYLVPIVEFCGQRQHGRAARRAGIHVRSRLDHHAYLLNTAGHCGTQQGLTRPIKGVYIGARFNKYPNDFYVLEYERANQQGVPAMIPGINFSAAIHQHLNDLCVFGLEGALYGRIPMCVAGVRICARPEQGSQAIKGTPNSGAMNDRTSHGIPKINIGAGVDEHLYNLNLPAFICRNGRNLQEGPAIYMITYVEICAMVNVALHAGDIAGLNGANKILHILIRRTVNARRLPRWLGHISDVPPPARSNGQKIKGQFTLGHAAHFNSPRI